MHHSRYCMSLAPGGKPPHLPQDKSALPTAPSPLPERSGFWCRLCVSGCVYLGPLGCLQTLWSGNIPGLCQPSLACRARRALTGTKRRRGWVEGLVYHSIKSCRANWGNEHVPFSLAKYLVSDFCWNTFLFIWRLAFGTNPCYRSAQINGI